MLEQTKGYSKFRGIITGLTDGKRNPVEILSFGTKLSFSLATSPNNRIYVDILAFNGAEDRDVYFAGTEKGMDIIKKPYEQRYEEIEGYRLLGTQLKKPGDKDVTILTDIDAIQYISDNFKDGDSVFIEAEMNKFVSGNSTRSSHKIRKMFSTTKPIDFKDEDFEELAEFRDNFVFSEAVFNKKDKKAIVEGYFINYKLEPTLVSYAINVEDKDDYAIFEYLQKNVKFGDLVGVEGIVHNRVVGHREEAEDDGEPEFLVGKRAKSFTGSKKGRFVVDFEQKELEITAITSVEKGKYTLDDINGESDDIISNDDEKLPWED